MTVVAVQRQGPNVLFIEQHKTLKANAATLSVTLVDAATGRLIATGETT